MQTIWPHFDLLLSRLNCALFAVDASVRAASVDCLRLVLRAYPRLAQTNALFRQMMLKCAQETGGVQE